MNKRKMKTINLNAEPECDFVLTPRYSEANNGWCFLLILEREVVSAACFIQLTSETERMSERTKRKDLLNSLLPKSMGDLL